MPRSSSRAAIVFLITALLAFLAGYERARLPPATRQGLLTATPAPEPRPAARSLPLVAGTEIPAILAGGEAHEYSLSLREGQFVDLEVEQQGIDVILELYQPGGDLETLVDSPNDASGPEPLLLLGEAAGEYRLSIAAGNPADPSGRYILRLLAVHEAGADDRTRVTAERMFAKGEGLRRAGTAESLTEAIDWDRQALLRYRSLESRSREADVLVALGRVHSFRDDWQQALSAFEQALPILREAGRGVDEAATLNNIGLVLNKTEQSQRALDLFRQAEALYRRFGHPHQARALSNIGWAHEKLGDLEDAIQAYRDAYTQFLRLSDSPGAGICMLNIGDLYSRQGQTESAIDAYEEARARLEKSPDRRSLALTQTRLGYARYRSGQAEQGRELLETALEMQRRLGARRDEAISHNSLALLLSEAAETELAKLHYHEAAAIGTALGDEAERAVTLANLGHLELESGSDEAAEGTFREALATFARVDSPLGEATALFGLGTLLAQQGKLSEAASVLERCTRRVEDVRNATASSDLRRSFLALQQPTYGLYIETLMRLHAADVDAGFDLMAFEVAQRVRARGLLDDLLASPAALRRDGPHPLVEEEAALSQAINRTAEERQPLLAIPRSRQKVDDLGKVLRGQLAAADHLEARMRRSSTAFRETISAPAQTLETIQQQLLGAETILLEYALGNNESYLWAVTDSSLSSFRLPPRRELEAQAAALYRALSLGPQPLASGQTEALLKKLSETLLGPVAELVGDRRILVIPDGDLALLPFAALPRPSTAAKAHQKADSEPIATGHEVTILPSASSLAFLRRRSRARSSAPGLLAAIGDAVSNPGDLRFPRRPPVPPGSQLIQFPRLPYARAEMERILSLAGEEPKLAASGFEASRSTLMTEVLSRYRIVHFATHGVFDPEFPELSAIVLSTFDASGSPRDGLVRAHELRRMNFNAELVVVSACETARGKTVRGEGVVGLARSLLSAGAQQAMVSLWEVDDQATANLMEEFYRGLLVERRSAAAALLEAQAAVARQERWHSPYFWAGFLLIGDGSGLGAKPHIPPSHLRRN